MGSTIEVRMGLDDHQPDRITPQSFSRGDAASRADAASALRRSAYLFALQLTRDPDAAQDVAQESALRFYRNLERFDVNQPVEPWLYSIVRNQVRDRARRERHRAHESLDDWLDRGIGEDGAEGSDPALIAERREAQRQVWIGIGKLSEFHREIVVLRDFHDLSYAEIAEVLAIPRGTVMSRLHTARQSLRRQMEVDGDRTNLPGGESDE